MPVLGPQAEAARSKSERVVVLAPTARDAEVTAQLLAQAGVESVSGRDWPHVEGLLRDGAGALMLADTTLMAPGFGSVVKLLQHQPRWSNLPVLALCRRGLQSPVLRQAALDNLTVLDRPTSAGVMISAVKAALRARRVQYQVRDQIESLQRADMALRQADRRKDEFLATLAHELRNPLAPIRSGLQLLMRGPEDEAQRQHVMAMMDRQMTQLLRLIDDLLEVSRISTGKLTLQREELDLKRVVETALESSGPLVARAGHHLHVSWPDEVLWVDGDLARLAQALSNLVNNAAKYTPDGGRIDVTLARDGAQGVLSVQDSGVGLPADMIGFVFDMFAQVNRSLDRSQGGLGIGLALVRSLVALHGGLVSANSPGVGQGSTFTIRLPLVQQSAAPQLQAAPPPQAGQARRVLVVDDNEDAATALGMLLSLGGHDVQVEHSGAAALQAAARFQPQAVFCDVGMPGMDGYQVATALRQDARFAGTLLVALTGRGSEDDKKHAREAGFDAHLTKPASEAAMSALLATL
ncbi:ATP-binding protein [Roseateles sp. DC23W]|uniref:histidine kinase n=1 Tax=Pelomonas dachongensis TaxID=3299029 RepID=A0ABW7ER48_9BURK